MSDYTIVIAIVASVFAIVDIIVVAIVATRMLYGRSCGVCGRCHVDQ